MTATDELRRLLDERGMKYRDYFHTNKTWWSGRENVGWCAEDRPNANGLYVMIEAVLTPEQAIAATLGSGTCHNIVFAEMDEKAGKKYSMAMTALRFGGFMPEDEPAEFECSACRETAKVDWETLYQMDYCPFCGARIVEAES